MRICLRYVLHIGLKILRKRVILLKCLRSEGDPPPPGGFDTKKKHQQNRLKNSIFPFEFPFIHYFLAPAARFVFVSDPETEEMFGHELPPRKRKRHGSDSDIEIDEDFSERPRKKKKETAF